MPASGWSVPLPIAAINNTSTTSVTLVGSTSVASNLVKSNTAATIAVTSTVADAGTAIKLAADTNLTSGKIVTIGDNNGTSYAEKAFYNVDGELELTTVGKGIILKSPDGTRYRLTIDNGGTASISAA